MSEALEVEAGHYGRLLLARIKPNRDLIESLEALCAEHGVKRAMVRSALGSLIDAHLFSGQGQNEQTISGPGVEILNVAGEVFTDTDGQLHTVLSGSVAGIDGKLHAGKFKRGANLAFITLEVSLQEWLADALNDEPAATPDPVSNTVASY